VASPTPGRFPRSGPGSERRTLAGASASGLARYGLFCPFLLATQRVGSEPRRASVVSCGSRGSFLAGLGLRRGHWSPSHVVGGALWCPSTPLRCPQKALISRHFPANSRHPVFWSPPARFCPPSVRASVTEGCPPLGRSPSHSARRTRDGRNNSPTIRAVQGLGG
jgi:hypothetical protein